MKKVILSQNEEIVLQYTGGFDETARLLTDLGSAIYLNVNNDNYSLFVKTGYYQKKKKATIYKYVNVPQDYYIIISNYLIGKNTNDIINIEKISKVLSPKAFREKYHILADSEEPTLFDDLEDKEKEQEEYGIHIDDLKDLELAKQKLKNNKA